MKTRKANTFIAICLCLVIFSSMSCEMFTTSLFKDAARDMSETMKNASTSDLLASGNNADILGDQAASQAALEELGKRDLENITPVEAANVCGLASSAILPVSTLMGAIDKIMNATDTEDSDSDGSGDSEKTDNTADIITEILASIPKVETTAIETVLQNDTLVKETEIGSVAMATVSLMVSSLSKADLDQETQKKELEQITDNLNNKLTEEEIKDGISTEDVTKVLEGTQFAEDTAMQTAIKAALIMKDRDDLSSLSNSNFILLPIL